MLGGGELDETAAKARTCLVRQSTFESVRI